MRQSRLAFFCFTLLFGLAPRTPAEEVSFAVASNFASTARELIDTYLDGNWRGGNKYHISPRSTAKLTTQIQQGAPFDVLLSADQFHVQTLIDEGLAVKDTSFTYALGILVLYSASEPDLIQGKDTLREGKFQKISLANPAFAPYGKAALEVMQKLKVEEKLRPKFVLGSNLLQAFSYIETGNAELGFVALAQVLDAPPGSYWVIPQDLYRPIRQDAVLLKRAEKNAEARRFLDFLRSPQAQAIIKKAGYRLEAP